MIDIPFLFNLILFLPPQRDTFPSFQGFLSVNALKTQLKYWYLQERRCFPTENNHLNHKTNPTSSKGKKLRYPLYQQHRYYIFKVSFMKPTLPTDWYDNDADASVFSIDFSSSLVFGRQCELSILCWDAVMRCWYLAFALKQHIYIYTSRVCRYHPMPSDSLIWNEEKRARENRPKRKVNIILNCCYVPLLLGIALKLENLNRKFM